MIVFVLCAVGFWRTIVCVYGSLPFCVNGLLFCFDVFGFNGVLFFFGGVLTVLMIYCFFLHVDSFLDQKGYGSIRNAESQTTHPSNAYR